MLAEPEDAGLLVSGTGQDRKADGSPASSASAVVSNKSSDLPHAEADATW